MCMFLRCPSISFRSVLPFYNLLPFWYTIDNTKNLCALSIVITNETRITNDAIIVANYGVAQLIGILYLCKVSVATKLSSSRWRQKNTQSVPLCHSNQRGAFFIGKSVPHKQAFLSRTLRQIERVSHQCAKEKSQLLYSSHPIMIRHIRSPKSAQGQHHVLGGIARRHSAMGHQFLQMHCVPKQGESCEDLNKNCQNMPKAKE